MGETKPPDWYKHNSHMWGQFRYFFLLFHIPKEKRRIQLTCDANSIDLLPSHQFNISSWKASVKESKKKKSRRQKERRRLGRPPGKPMQATTSSQMLSR
jgi:hypothetical protein